MPRPPTIRPPEREQDRILAAEFVLGTLEAAERAEARQRMRSDAAFAGLVRHWQKSLTPLHELAAPIAPPPELWRAILADLPAPPPAKSTAAGPPAAAVAKGAAAAGRPVPEAPRSPGARPGDGRPREAAPAEVQVKDRARPPVPDSPEAASGRPGEDAPLAEPARRRFRLPFGRRDAREGADADVAAPTPSSVRAEPTLAPPRPAPRESRAEALKAVSEAVSEDWMSLIGALSGAAAATLGEGEAPAQAPQAEAGAPQAEAGAPQAEAGAPQAEAGAPQAEGRAPQAEGRGAPTEGKAPQAEGRTRPADERAPQAEGRGAPAEGRTLQAEDRTLVGADRAPPAPMSGAAVAPSAPVRAAANLPLAPLAAPPADVVAERPVRDRRPGWLMARLKRAWQGRRPVAVPDMDIALPTVLVPPLRTAALAPTRPLAEGAASAASGPEEASLPEGAAAMALEALDAPAPSAAAVPGGAMPVVVADAAAMAAERPAGAARTMEGDGSPAGPAQDAQQRSAQEAPPDVAAQRPEAERAAAVVHAAEAPVGAASATDAFAGEAPGAVVSAEAGAAAQGEVPASAKVSAAGALSDEVEAGAGMPALAPEVSAAEPLEGQARSAADPAQGAVPTPGEAQAGALPAMAQGADLPALAPEAEAPRSEVHEAADREAAGHEAARHEAARHEAAGPEAAGHGAADHAAAGRQALDTETEALEAAGGGRADGQVAVLREALQDVRGQEAVLPLAGSPEAEAASLVPGLAPAVPPVPASAEHLEAPPRGMAESAAWRAAVALLAVLVAGLAGLLAYREWFWPRDGQYVAVLQGTPAPAVALRIDPESGVVFAHALAPAPPAGKLYHLWLVTPGDGAVELGRFSTAMAARAEGVRRLDPGALRAAQVRVTVEPKDAKGLAGPAGPVVFEGRLVPE